MSPNFFLLVLGIYITSFSRCKSKTIMEVEKLKAFYKSLPPVDFTLADAVKTDVIYKYFKDESETVGKILTEESVAEENLNKHVPTVLLMHGWTTDDTSPWYDPLKEAYFKQGPHNIIYINWSEAGNKSYPVSSANVKPVGKYMAQFLIASGIPLDKVHLIGHSLGSQLSAFIGKSTFELTGKKIGRITALDPAGPKFENPLMGPESRLCESDADFVDVIHTDIQISGYTAPLGHVDFYPNEGKHQPGCPSREEDDNCSHARSTRFFIESVGTKTNSKEATFNEINNVVTISVKENAKEIVFGQHVDKSARGIYYFVTNNDMPYLK